MITIETRIVDHEKLAIVDRINEWLSQMMRVLFVLVFVRGRKRGDVKAHFSKLGVGSTHFNSLLNQLDAKATAILELNKVRAADLAEAIKATKKTISNKERQLKRTFALIKCIESHKAKTRAWQTCNQLPGKAAVLQKKKKPSMPKSIRGRSLDSLRQETKELRFTIHQKKRRKTILEQRLAQLEKNRERVSICFGSRKLFRAQFNLEENGFKSHEEWLVAWRAARSSSSFWLGSHDEEGHNRNVRYDMGAGTLRLRLPDALVEENKGEKHLVLNDVVFSYGQEALKRAWTHEEIRTCKQGKHKGEKCSYQRPISYRIVSRKTKQGLRRHYVQASFDAVLPEISSRREIGAFGVDLNADHLAVAELDRFGNPVRGFSYRFNLKGQSSKQNRAAFGDFCAELVDLAHKAGKVIVCEDLDFARKKAGLREKGGHRYSSMLSSLAYSTFYEMLSSRCAKTGVELLRVNPAYTSVIGFYRYRNCKKFSTHEMAAVAIGRRGLGMNERVNCHGVTRPRTELILGKSGQASQACAVQHVPGKWRAISSQIRQELRENRVPRQKSTFLLPKARPSGRQASLNAKGLSELAKRGARPPSDRQKPPGGCMPETSAA